MKKEVWKFVRHYVVYRDGPQPVPFRDWKKVPVGDFKGAFSAMSAGYVPASNRAIALFGRS